MFFIIFSSYFVIRGNCPLRECQFPQLSSSLGVELGIEHLVYTSSYNAVFYGQKLSNVTSVPYPPLDLHVDEYSRSKTQAERLVLESNGKATKRAGVKLSTCAIRPAAIYGPAEMRHFPRLLDTMHKGMLKFTIGDPHDLVDWVYIDNLVYGHLLAAYKLKSAPSGVAGEAFAISDHDAMNNWEFMKPLFTELGYWYPTIRIPTVLAFYFAYFLEILHMYLSPYMRFEPFLARAEVVKVGVEHYFNPEKARTKLGYEPVLKSKEGMARTVAYFKKGELEWQRKHGATYMLAHYLLAGFIALLVYYYLFLR